MKWLIFTTSLGIVNIATMTLFASNKLGQTPVMLPVLLILFALCCIFISSKKILKDKAKQNIASLVLWVGLAVYNLWQLQLLMYVS